jgi:hypothetical protein
MKTFVCLVSNNHSHKNIKLIQKYSPFEVIVLGEDKKPWNSHKKKLIAVQEFCSKLKETSIIIHMDAHDTMFSNFNSEQIISTFKSFNCDIVFGSEKDWWPYDIKAHVIGSFQHHCNKFNIKYPNIDNDKIKFKYLNSGCYIGYSDKIKNVLDKIIPWKGVKIYNTESCQDILHKYFVLYYEFHNIKLDYEQKLFYNMAGSFQKDYIEYINPDTFILNTGIKPCIIHGNGSSEKYFIELFKNFYSNII